MAKPTDDEINEQMSLALEQMDNGGSQVPGMSYEEGVETALRWALGDSADAPMDM